MNTAPAVAGRNKWPAATYRLQVNAAFPFVAAERALPYLNALGISHLYLSPVFKARPGSAHGYDVVDHGVVNPELGGLDALKRLARAAHDRGMGLILDIVPNHMAILTQDNPWWLDVLENGPAAKCAGRFDIDWSPLRHSMRNRLLVPVLAEPYGVALEEGRVSVTFEERAGSFTVRYGNLVFPIDPRTYPLVFQDRTRQDEPLDDAADWQDLTSLLDGFAALPRTDDTAAERRAQRYRDKEVNKRRLARLYERAAGIGAYIETALRQLNGERGNPATFDGLARLLDAQPYRLAHWRVSGEEINYRRFFDVDNLAALRIEDPVVFDATHHLVAELAREDVIDGVRVDHADGLLDPEQYFVRLRSLLRDAMQREPYIVAEKILAASEQLPAAWRVEGTTGYEFGALVTAWLVDPGGRRLLDSLQARHAGVTAEFAEIAYAARKQVMRTTLAAEITVLSIQLDRLAQAHRSTIDFTSFALREGIVEVIACFPVYRTYVSQRGISPEDGSMVTRAVAQALGRRQADHAVIMFLRDVLLGLTDTDEPERRAAALEFAMKFQQVTGPVMAKGLEDTSLYRYPRLLALNEVGSDPRIFSLTTAELHAANLTRVRHQPQTMVSTATHDSKRGEDTRYRICVLSELAPLWGTRVKQFMKLPPPGVRSQDRYLMLQTLLGIWPMEDAASAASFAGLRERSCAYAVKAAREAKQETSWKEPDEAYERDLVGWVQGLMDDNGEPFLTGFASLITPVLYFGMMNALGAVVLKMTSPGMPDLYQGTELPGTVLVDPDNRGTVDFDRLAAVLASVDAMEPDEGVARVDALMSHWRDGAIKLHVTSRLLRMRRDLAGCFRQGTYEPLRVTGHHATKVAAFVRCTPGSPKEVVIVVVARFTATLTAGAIVPPCGAALWQDTRIVLHRSLPAGPYQDVFTGRSFTLNPAAQASDGLVVGEILGHLPVAVLLSTEVPLGRDG